MKLKTIKKRLMDGSLSNSIKIIAILLGDKVWSDDHVLLLCQCLVIAKNQIVGAAKWIKNSQGVSQGRSHDLTLLELDRLPEWVKFKIIMHDPELGEIFFTMSESLKNTWTLIR